MKAPKNKNVNIANFRRSPALTRTPRAANRRQRADTTDHWLAEGGPEKCGPEHFTSKFKAKCYRVDCRG